MLIDYKGTIDAASRKPHIGFRVLSGKAPGQEIVLRPGVQEIAPKAWDAVRESKAVAHLIDAGAIVVLEDEGGKGAKFDIAKRTPADVRDLVARTTVPAILRGWKAALANKTGDLWIPVNKAIDDQIAACTTDANGQPAEQRVVTLPKTAHG